MQLLYEVKSYPSSDKMQLSLCFTKNQKRPKLYKTKLRTVYQEFTSEVNEMLNLTLGDLVCWGMNEDSDDDTVTLTLDMRHIISWSDLVIFGKKLVNRYSFALLIFQHNLEKDINLSLKCTEYMNGYLTLIMKLEEKFSWMYDIKKIVAELEKPLNQHTINTLTVEKLAKMMSKFITDNCWNPANCFIGLSRYNRKVGKTI